MELGETPSDVQLLEVTSDASVEPIASGDGKDDKRKQMKKKSTFKELKDINGDKQKFEGQVSYFTLYRYADKYDYIMLVAALIGAVAHGVSQPLMSIIFGSVINSFDPTAVVNIADVVSGNAKWFVILGAATAVVSYFQQMGFLLSSHRQVNVIRKSYFRALTRQNMGWYDKQEVGALTSRIGRCASLLVPFTCFG